MSGIILQQQSFQKIKRGEKHLLYSKILGYEGRIMFRGPVILFQGFELKVEENIFLKKNLFVLTAKLSFWQSCGCMLYPISVSTSKKVAAQLLIKEPIIYWIKYNVIL